MRPLRRHIVQRLDTAFLRAFRADALTSQHGKCAYCVSSLTASEVTADHVHPRKHGGRNRKDNIVAACEPCNTAKGSLSAPVFVKIIKRPPADAPWCIWRAWVRRKLNIRIGRAERRILASVGVTA